MDIKYVLNRIFCTYFVYLSLGIYEASEILEYKSVRKEQGIKVIIMRQSKKKKKIILNKLREKDTLYLALTVNTHIEPICM